MKGHRIEKFEEVAEFYERMKHFDVSSIECTAHTFFRLSEAQRKVFTEDNLKNFLLHEVPLKVGVQHNGNYAVYYKYREKTAIKLVIDIKLSIISVVTFYIVDISQIPR